MTQTARIAFYDLDGTLVSSNIVTRYSVLIRRLPSRPAALWKNLRLVSSVPTYLLLDRISRRMFNQVFFQSYRGMSCDWLEQQAEDLFERAIRPVIYPGAIELVKRDRQQGFRVVLVTGEIGSLLKPVERYFGFDAIVCNSLVFENGVATGEVSAPLIAEEEKVKAMQQVCRDYQAELAKARAYSDSFSDVPMLAAAGSPFAVNPDARLRKVAKTQGWPVLDLSNQGKQGIRNHVHVS
ncbi:MAG: HAD family hydrolase [Terriglobia bacterium]